MKMGKQIKGKKQKLWLLVLSCILLILEGCSNVNLVTQSGFPLPNSAVVINYDPFQLINDENYIKATLTMAQAETLHKSFLARPISRYLDATFLPKQFPRIPGNKQWTPQSIKKYWSGSFDIGQGQDAYYCQYIFDIHDTTSVVFYFYGISSIQ